MEPQVPRVGRSSTMSTVRSQISSTAAAVTRRATSFMVQARNPRPTTPKKTKEKSYPTYQLKWEKFKDWLENRFPEYKGTFEERRVINDHYTINIPESLTAEDESEINKLRDDSGKDQARREQSEEPQI